jgi:hypothetical protein
MHNPASLTIAALDFIALRRAYPGEPFLAALRFTSLPRFIVVSGSIYSSLNAAIEAGAVALSAARAGRLTTLLAKTGVISERQDEGDVVRIHIAYERDFARHPVDGVGLLDLSKVPMDATHIQFTIPKPMAATARRRSKQRSASLLLQQGYSSFRERSKDEAAKQPFDPDDFIG